MSELMLDVALEYAVAGMRIFPLDETTCLPIFANWPSKATRDPALIKSWWTCPVTGFHRAHNVGVATGDGVIVLDVDVKGGAVGEQSLATLEAFNEALPDGPTVRTGSGGYHRYFKLPKGARLGNSAGKLGTNLDTRGERGYVVAAGSAKFGNPYEWLPGKSLSDLQMPELPRVYVDMLKVESKKKDAPADTELDTLSNMAAARDYLLRADPAIEGAGGNDRTFKTAAAVRDYGVSETTCLEIMLEQWNERCEPPWSLEELQRIVGNAYRYGENAAGCLSPDAIFSEIETADEPTNSLKGPSWVVPIDPRDIPLRQWVVQDVLCRRNLTLFVARSGAGKTTQDIHLALSIATGRSEITGFEVKERTKVWYCNGEDDKDELDRRMCAAIQAHGIAWKDVLGRLAIDSFRNLGFRLISRANKTGAMQPDKSVDALVKHIIDNDIGVVMIDPLQELHDAEENDNMQMQLVAAILRDIAWRTGAAVMIVHHTRKPANSDANGDVGNMDAGRGASSIQGVCRILLTMGTMTERQAEAEGVNVEHKNAFVQFHVTKNNIGRDNHGQWYRRVSVPLGRPDLVGLEPEKGVDYVGALMPVTLGSKRPVPMTVYDLASIWPKADRVERERVVERLCTLPLLSEETPERIDAKLGQMLAKDYVLDGWRYRLDELQIHGTTKRFVERQKAEGPDSKPDPNDEILYMFG